VLLGVVVATTMVREIRRYRDDRSCRRMASFLPPGPLRNDRDLLERWHLVCSADSARGRPEKDGRCPIQRKGKPCSAASRRWPRRAPKPPAPGPRLRPEDRRGGAGLQRRVGLVPGEGEPFATQAGRIGDGQVRPVQAHTSSTIESAASRYAFRRLERRSELDAIRLLVVVGLVFLHSALVFVRRGG
jgi:hypothetical protein